ncbi:hypothetical protein A3Q56_02909 [Intoshia linei]|uniref:Uncharacterized protein n=1 Tax=Intoshia linei TaxID=1819745 RepID=A0A177B4X0_9BILA|nr:hypothetical protein A3Q56_02909 [Intoshia linei]
MFGEEHNARCIIRVEMSLKEQFDFIELELRRELDTTRIKSRLSDGLNVFGRPFLLFNFFDEQLLRYVCMHLLLLANVIAIFDWLCPSFII